MPAALETSPILIAIAGASGFIGQRLVRRLARDEAGYAALTRRPIAPIANEQIVPFDLADPAVADSAALDGVTSPITWSMR